jgi:YbbR domain-containing protein
VQRFAPQWRRVTTPIALAFLSLISAIVLWVAVTDAENPNRVSVFSGGIEVQAVNVGEGLAVSSIRDPHVSLKISADEDTFRKLTTADFRAEVDMTGVRQPSSQQVVLTRVASRRDVQIIEVSPAFVTVTLETATTKQVPVQPNLIGSLPQGYSIASVEPSPSTVRVTGASSLVQLVSGAAADVNLTGLRANLEQQLTLSARDARGADLRGVRIEPTSAEIRVAVTQQEVTLPLTIVPQVQGSVADGYNLVAIATDPPAIAASGPLELLQAVTFITTEPIDASGLRADLTRTVRLRVPAGLQSTRDTVTVRLKIAPAQGEIALAVAPQVSGLAEGLRASLQTASITVRLRGDLPTLRSLQPGSVKATVSADGLDEGIHVLDAALGLPEGVQVTSVDPRQVVVVLRR